MPLLEVSDLRVSYGKALAIESVSIKVDKGELVGVLGPNGAGKTTLLKAISRTIGSQGKLTFKDQTLDGVAPYDGPTMWSRAASAIARKAASCSPNCRC